MLPRFFKIFILVKKWGDGPPAPPPPGSYGPVISTVFFTAGLMENWNRVALVYVNVIYMYTFNKYIFKRAGQRYSERGITNQNVGGGG